MTFVFAFLDQALNPVPIATVAIETTSDALQAKSQVGLGDIEGQQFAYPQHHLAALLLGGAFVQTEKILFVCDLKFFEIVVQSVQ